MIFYRKKEVAVMGRPSLSTPRIGPHQNMKGTYKFIDTFINKKS